MSLSVVPCISQTDNCKSFTLADDTGIYTAVTNTGGYGAPNPEIADIDTATLEVTKYLATTTYTINVYSTLPNITDTTFTINNTDIGLTSTEKIVDGVYGIKYTVSGGFTITAVNQGTKVFTVSGDKSSTFIVGDTFTVLGSTGNDATYTITAISYSNPNTLITVSEAIPHATADGKIRFSTYTTIYEMFFCNGQACLYDKLKLIEVSECADCNESKVALVSKINTFLLAAQYATRCGKPNKTVILLNYLTKLCAATSCRDC